MTGPEVIVLAAAGAVLVIEFLAARWRDRHAGPQWNGGHALPDPDELDADEAAALPYRPPAGLCEWCPPGCLHEPTGVRLVAESQLCHPHADEAEGMLRDM